MNTARERLSSAQQRALVVLPIPSALLSIVGSSIILYMSVKFKGKWTPYTRLLIGLSISDIIFSINIAIANFLRPFSSHRTWAFGNDATCSASGFLTQLAKTAEGYTVMLSFYFILTARFGYKNSYIAKRFEPLMHFIAIGYFLVTAIVGAILGVYADNTVFLGCWVGCCFRLLEHM
eukprot:scaffold2799_cov117-Cylindrotheca_fusiformis.AAC.5